jgi:hypothetical protein
MRKESTVHIASTATITKPTTRGCSTTYVAAGTVVRVKSFRVDPDGMKLLVVAEDGRPFQVRADETDAVQR